MSKTITITLHSEEAIEIVEAIPPDKVDATIEDYILIADRMLRGIRVSERDALSEIFGRLDGFEQTFRQMIVNSYFYYWVIWASLPTLNS